MSSYYSAVQLEAMRKEQLRNKLNQSLESLKKSICEYHDNKVGHRISFGTVHSVRIDDIVNNKFGFSGEIGESSYKGEECGEREGINLSGLLSVGRGKSKNESNIIEIIKQKENRAILYNKDLVEKEKLEEGIRKILEDQSIDLESKTELIEMKIDSFLRSGTLIEDVDEEYVISKYDEYEALCKMMGVVPTEMLLERVEQECILMREELQKQEENKYIADTISQIMEELGCQGTGKTILQHVYGEMFNVSGCKHCNVFLGKQGKSIMFEPVIDSRDGSENQRKEVQQEIASVCTLYAEIERLAAERGVFLTKVDFNPVSVDNAVVKQNKGKEKGQKNTHHRSKKTLKERQMGDK